MLTPVLGAPKRGNSKAQARSQGDHAKRSFVLNIRRKQKKCNNKKATAQEQHNQVGKIRYRGRGSSEFLCDDLSAAPPFLESKSVLHINQFLFPHLAGFFTILHFTPHRCQ